MSKIGRKPIDISDIKVEIKGNEVHYTGKNESGVHVLPDFLSAKIEDNKLFITFVTPVQSRNKFWGLHRALLANKIHGANNFFERKLEIIGLGYKGKLVGNTVTLNLGFSHPVDFQLPEGVELTIDKTGKFLFLKSSDKELVGKVSSEIRALRPPEPYKGTGIKFAEEVILRKAGKAKA